MRHGLRVGSLVLFLLAVAGWVRAQWADDLIYRHGWEVRGGVGRLGGPSVEGYRDALSVGVEEFTFVPYAPTRSQAWLNRFWIPTDVTPGTHRLARDAVHRADDELRYGLMADGGFERWGFAIGRREYGLRGYEFVRVGGRDYQRTGWSRTSVAIPWWFLAVTFGAGPALGAWRRWRGRRRGANCCAGCGYDLRATPDAAGALLGVCPECGRRRDWGGQDALLFDVRGGFGGDEVGERPVDESAGLAAGDKWRLP